MSNGSSRQLITFFITSVFLFGSFSSNVYAKSLPDVKRDVAQSWLENQESKNINYERLLTLSAGSNKFSLTDDTPLVIYERFTSNAPEMPYAFQVLVNNGLEGTAQKTILDWNLSDPKESHLRMLLNYLQPGPGLNDKGLNTANAVYLSLLKNKKTIDPELTVKLAVLYYSAGDVQRARQLLNAISGTNPGKEYLLGSLAIRDGQYQAAAEIFGLLCFGREVEEPYKSAACLSQGKAHAAAGDFGLAADSFNLVRPDSSYFGQGVYESIWSNWRRGAVIDAITASNRWRSLFPDQHTTFEVGQLTSLALLQSNSYRQALGAYEDVLNQILLEIAEVNSLLRHYRGQMDQFVYDFHDNRLTHPISQRLRKFLQQHANFIRIEKTAQSTRDLSLWLADSERRLARLTKLVEEKPTLYQPDAINRLAKGLFLLDWLSGKTLPSEEVEGEKGRKQSLEILDMERRYQEILYYLSKKSTDYFGLKRNTLRTLLKNTVSRLEHLEAKLQNIKTLENEKSVFTTPLKQEKIISRWRRVKGYDTQPFEVPTELTEVANNIFLSLKQEAEPAVVDVAAFANQIDDLNRKRASLSKVPKSMETRFSGIADSAVPFILNKYRKELNDLKGEIEWGMINGKIRHVQFQQQRNEEYESATSEIMSRVNQSFDQ